MLNIITKLVNYPKVIGQVLDWVLIKKKAIFSFKLFLFCPVIGDTLETSGMKAYLKHFYTLINEFLKLIFKNILSSYVLRLKQN